MPKYCATITALFCLLTLSLAAHTPPENDEDSTQVSLPNTDNQFKPIAVTSLTLTKIPFPFRAVNRRFPVRPKHPCRHGHRVHSAVTRNEEIPDTIFSSGENSDFKEPVVYGGGRRIPYRRLRPHHHHHVEDRDGHDEEHVDRIAIKRHGFDPFDREKELKVLKKLRKHFRVQNGEEMEKMKKKGGFMRRVRKFLDYYF